MKVAVLASLVLLLAASSAPVTLLDSNTTFRRALNACSGTLGSVTFALAHARTAGAPGIAIDESPGDETGMLSVVFASVDGSKSAHVEINQHTRSVHAKHVRVEMNRRVACILPD